MALALRLAPFSPACSEHDLVAAARDGDDRAFEELYSRYRERIGAFIFSKVHDHGRAEDIAQDVFMSALRRLRATDQEMAFKPWLYEIAKNACIDEFRRSKRTREVSLDADEELTGGRRGLLSVAPTPPAAAESKQRLDDLRGAFTGLSETQHQLLVMREFEGLSYTEIGARTGMSRQMVESGLFRARRKLSDEYDELASGRRCEQVQMMIEDGRALSASSFGIRERRRLTRHLAHCQPCRRTARMAGVDESLVKPRSIAAKIAALLPFPLWRWPWRGGSSAKTAASGGGSHSAAGAGSLSSAASAAAPAASSITLAQAAATVAALAVAGVGGGVVSGAWSGKPAAHRTVITSPARHATSSTAAASRTHLVVPPAAAKASHVTVPRSHARASHGSQAPVGQRPHASRHSAAAPPTHPAGTSPPATPSSTSPSRPATNAGSTGPSSVTTAGQTTASGVTKVARKTAHSVLPGTTPSVKKVLSTTSGVVSSTGKTVQSTVGSTVKTVGSTVGSTVKTVGSTVKTVGSAVNPAGSTVGSTTKTVGSTVNPAGSTVGSATKTVGSTARTVGTTTKTVQSTASGVTSSLLP